MKKNKCLYADHRCIVMSFHGLKMILVFANLIIWYWYFGVFIDVGGKENQEKKKKTKTGLDPSINASNHTNKHWRAAEIEPKQIPQISKIPRT